MLCRRKTDNRTTFTCPFHGWTFNNTGKLLKVKDPRGAGYPEQFNKDGSHDLTKVARFESYRGFLFGSLNPDVSPLEEHLGDATKIIDMIVDQSPDGLEVLRGSSTYTYDGNWKVQAENGADGYHVSATHWNYAATTARRSTGESANETKAMDAGGWGKQSGGYYSFENGHLLLWTEWGNPQDRPLWDRRDELVAEVRRGQGRLDAQHLPQPLPLPERLHHGPVRLADPALPPDRRRQDRGHHLLHRPQGRERRGRASRIRQYEDFFNATGMATPDDLEEFRSCQKTYLATAAPWNDMSRGAEHWIAGPDDDAKTHRPRPHLQRGPDRGRGPLPRPARLLEEDDARGGRAEAAAEAAEHGPRQRNQAARPKETHPMTQTVRRRPQDDPMASLADRESSSSSTARPATSTTASSTSGWSATHPDAEFWMPAWDDDDTLVTDPQREISLIYYTNRGGLEDRVFRIKTDRSSATSLPEPRTGHNITNVEIVDARRQPGRCALQLAHAVLPLPEHRPLLRHVVLHHRLLGHAAASSRRRRSS